MLALVLELLGVLLPFLKDGTSELGKMGAAVLRKHRATLDQAVPSLYEEIERAYTSGDHAHLSQLRARLYEMAGPSSAIQPGDEARYEDPIHPNP